MAKKKTSQATINRLRELRRKHGLGEFKGQKKRSVIKVARRRFSRGLSRRVSHGLKANQVALGAAGYAVAEPMIDQLVGGIGGQQGQILGVNTASLLKLGGGWYLASKGKSGFSKGLGAAMLSIEVHKFVKNANLLGGGAGAGGNGAGNGDGGEVGV